MTWASFDHAQQDIEARQLIEARNEAEAILSAVEKGSSHAAWQQLSSSELTHIAAAMDELRSSAAGNDYSAIRQCIERLDLATRRLAELMMDTEVLGSIKGQTMDKARQGMGQAPTAPHAFAKAEYQEDSIAVEDSIADEKP